MMRDAITAKPVNRVMIWGMVLGLLTTTAPAVAITWGEVDVDNEYPNVGAIIVDLGGTIGVFQMCSGTLVHERVVLTAGHCTDAAQDWLSQGALGVYVSFDLDTTAPGVELLPIAGIITHPEYDAPADPLNQHDVGALVLVHSVTGIQPVVLPDPGLLDQLKRDRVLRPLGGSDVARFTFVGYGEGIDWHGGGPGGAGSPPQTTDGGLRQIAESTYTSLLTTYLHTGQNVLHDDAGTCLGDSGGPAFWEPDEFTRTLVGFTSWGDAMCVATGFAFRADIPDTLDFVAGVIAGLSLNIGWANVQWPSSIQHTLSTVTRTEKIYGQVWIDGFTSLPGPTAGLTAQVGLGPDGSYPQDNPEWGWEDATFNVDVGNNDEFWGNFLPLELGTFDYAYRYSTDGGVTWLYADLDGTGNGYDPSKAGALYVYPSSEDP
jgi:hypothetical protein